MYSFKARIRYSEIDENQKMTLPALLDLFQDCCTFQSEDIGIGIDYLDRVNRAWVLTAWQIRIDRYPKLGEQVEVFTWAYGFKGFYGYRNFKLEDAQHKIIAYANSIWVYMDTESGRPARIGPEVIKDYCLEPPLDAEWAGRKMELPSRMRQERGVLVQRFHIDTNHHVNNGKYILIAEEYLPKEFRVSSLRVEYKRAAVLGDMIYPAVYAGKDRVCVSLKGEENIDYANVEFR